MLKTQEDLFHEFFIFSLFVTVSIMSCISELTVYLSASDLTADGGYMQKIHTHTQKKNPTNKNVTIEFHDLCTCISNNFWALQFLGVSVWSTCQNHPPVKRSSAQARGLRLRRRPPYWNRRLTPTLLRKKWWVRFVPRFTFPKVGIYILNNI